jgi:hypothetical protein
MNTSELDSEPPSVGNTKREREAQKIGKKTMQKGWLN